MANEDLIKDVFGGSDSDSDSDAPAGPSEDAGARASPDAEAPRFRSSLEEPLEDGEEDDDAERAPAPTKGARDAPPAAWRARSPRAAPAIAPDRIPARGSKAP